ncbi:MAG: hypothetical protein AAF614_12245 [Chloroflexota bacterium]
MNPKLLIALVLLLIVTYVVSASSLIGWEPTLDDSRWQSLVVPSGLAIRDITPASSGSGCQVNVNRRELIVLDGIACVFDIQPGSSGVRAFSLRLSEGNLNGDVVLRLIFEEKPLTVKRQIAPLQSESFELYEEGGQLSLPVCENEGMPCVLKVTNSSR